MILHMIGLIVLHRGIMSGLTMRNLVTKMSALFKRISFISDAIKKLMEEQGFSNPEHVQVLTKTILMTSAISQASLKTWLPM